MTYTPTTGHKLEFKKKIFSTFTALSYYLWSMVLLVVLQSIAYTPGQSVTAITITIQIIHPQIVGDVWARTHRYYCFRQANYLFLRRQFCYFAHFL